MLNLAYYLEQTAKRYPDITATILDDLRLSYAEVAAYARRVANVLTAKGVGPGSRVALMIPNTPHFPIIYYGILHTGATVVPVNVQFQKNEIAHYLRDSESTVFFAFNYFEEQALAAFEAVPTCKHFIEVGPPDWLLRPEVGENFAHLVAEASDRFDTVQTQADDTAVILYTSGTTGAPKGAQLTHFNLFFNAFYSGHHITSVTPGERVLVVLPLFHSFGQTCLMNASIMTAGTMTLLPRFETNKALEIIRRDQVAIIALVPTMYAFMLNAGDQWDLSSIRSAISGGAALPEEVHRGFKERFGITILEGYGLSETSPVATFTLATDEVRVGSIGKPIYGVEIRIRRDDGTFAGPNEAGEVAIRGHNIMKGYFRNPKATEAAIVDGWFLSGDIGKYDEDGYFYIVDRKKDLIIRGGMNIYPREIEEVIYTHPSVLETAVVGMPDSIRGEEVVAYVAPKDGSSLSADDISAFLQEQMAKYKWPKTVRVLPELPKGPTGKILKRVLREQAAHIVEESPPVAR